MDSNQNIRQLLASDRVTKATRVALLKRLEAPHVLEPKFFSGEELRLLRSVCARLVPDSEVVDIAGEIDARLSEGKTDGWRYDAQAPDGEAYKRGLGKINSSALERQHQPFMELRPEQQDSILLEIQKELGRFFEDILAEAVEVYYSHPHPQAEIGYEGFADAHGWFLRQETRPAAVKEKA